MLAEAQQHPPSGEGEHTLISKPGMALQRSSEGKDQQSSNPITIAPVDAPLGMPTAACYHAFSTLLAPEAPAAPPPRPIMEAPPPIQRSTSILHDPVCTMELTQALQRTAPEQGLRHQSRASARCTGAVVGASSADVHAASAEKGCLSACARELIHPIIKAGARDDPGIYRGITVTPVLFKLFAMVLEARLSGWEYVRWGRLACARVIAPWTMCLLFAPLSPKLNVPKSSSSLASWTSGTPLTRFQDTKCSRCWLGRG